MVLWFSIFSVGPLIFLGFYSIYQFEKALVSETIVRLEGNGREIENIFSDYNNLLLQYRDQFLSDPNLVFQLSMVSEENLIFLSSEFIKKTILTSASFYDPEGRLVSTVYRDERNLIRTFGQTSEKIFLNEKYISNLKERLEIGFVDTTNNKISLILFSKVISGKNKNLGYFEQIITISDLSLQKIKNKLKVELFLLSDNNKILASTNYELKKINPSVLIKNEKKLIDYELKNQNYGFLVYPVNWDRSILYFGIGTIKQDSQSLMRNIKITFFTTLIFTAVILIITILISINFLLKPVNQLIDGLKAFDSSDQLVQVSSTSQTEIGLLASAFNDMSYRIYRTRDDLRKKIKELEKTNVELKEAQSKLVHSAKMTSLGQLVAGVAHELNNPIGFIFSNTKHLKDYSEKLIELIDLAEKNPSLLEQKKKDFDFDFIKSDLPKLIKSCQDGAQRTRDIVVGLRNFSRLEEALLKEIDVREALDTTLELLKGEIKNRIQIHKQYEPVPKVQCYASQINQVFMNILSNAVHAIKNTGKIWITVLPLRAGPDQLGRVQISIQDSGEGMDSELIEKIFEPFFTTKEVGQGTGLGLSISYGIIQNHGGEIQVRSQKGVGTEFILIIPLVLAKV